MNCSNITNYYLTIQSQRTMNKRNNFFWLKNNQQWWPGGRTHDLPDSVGTAPAKVAYAATKKQ